MESGSASANICGNVVEHPVPLSESVVTPSSLQLPEVAASNDEGETRNQPEENEPPSKKAKTSEVWKYYDDIWVTKIGPDGGEVKEQWAKCKKCNYKGTKNTMRGTTVFWNHMKHKHNLVKGQQKLASSDGIILTYRYDAESSLRKWQLAMVMHEYPFNMVEHEYFIDFIKSLRLGFSLMSRISTSSSIMEMFVEERKKLCNMFKSISCHFSCIMDMWTSNQNKGYMCITVHWIDDNWHIQKRIVKFMHVKGNHTGQNLANEFVKGVMAMNLEKKLFALTLDNASANDKCVKEIIPILMKHEPLICDGVFFHVRCLCHILNLVAQDGLKAIASSVKNIRETIAIVKNSPLQWEEFQKCALECGLDVNKCLSLDVPTRWNSTFAMLSNAVYFKRVFERLLFLNETKYRRCAPTDEDWDKAQSLSMCLQKFSDATDLFSGHLYPTANLFWWKFCDIKLAIEEWSHDCDETISCMANAMQAKYEKYWDKSNIALAVACFLDPRYKKRLVEYFMKKIYHQMYDSELTAFMNVVKQLFQA